MISSKVVEVGFDSRPRSRPRRRLSEYNLALAVSTSVWSDTALNRVVDVMSRSTLTFATRSAMSAAGIEARNRRDAR